MTPKHKLFGLIGFPVKHSLSPRMHNAAFAKLKIKAKYKLFELPPQALGGFFSRLKKNNISGFNVTIPYKEKVLPYLNSKSSGVREIGAANTVLVYGKGKLKGFNTDYLGFSRHLKALKVAPKKVALIGAGGAARAVCFALGKIRAEEICIYDIDAYKSLGLVGRFKDVFGGVKFSAVADIGGLDLKNKDLLINTAPVGMRPEDPCLIDEKVMHQGLFVYDLIYNPAETKLLKAAKRAGLRCSNGLGMLLYQGALAFRHFTGREAPVETMEAALNRGVKKL